MGAWESPVSLGVYTTDSPTLIGDGQDTLYLAYTDGNHDIHLNVYDVTSGSWSGDKGIGLKSDKGPALGYWQGQLYLCWKDKGDDQLNLCKLDSAGQVSQSGKLKNAKSSWGPAMMATGDHMLVVHSGKDKSPKLWQDFDPHWADGEWKGKENQDGDHDYRADKLKAYSTPSLAPYQSTLYMAYQALKLTNPWADVTFGCDYAYWDVIANDWQSAKIELKDLKVKGLDLGVMHSQRRPGCGNLAFQGNEYLVVAYSYRLLNVPVAGERHLQWAYMDSTKTWYSCGGCFDSRIESEHGAALFGQGGSVYMVYADYHQEDKDDFKHDAFELYFSSLTPGVSMAELARAAG